MKVSNFIGVRAGVSALMLLVAVATPFVSALAQALGAGPAVLVQVADIPMPGAAVRFDYQSLDSAGSRLYISHMNADQLVVFDTASRTVVANLDGFKGVHGVLAVPEIDRVFASATGDHRAVFVDSVTLKTVATGGPITYPDGLAYAPREGKVFVSDEHGNVDAVLDATTGKLLANIPLGGGAGNTVYDSVSGHILVAVHGVNELVAIDPATNGVLGHYPMPGLRNPHGIALDTEDHLAFVAGEENGRLALVDLNSMRVLSTVPVGEDPDVVAYDSGLKRLYVSAESGHVTVFQVADRELKEIGSLTMPFAHTVAVDARTHLVYFPLQNVGGHPLLRIMRPAELR